MLMEHVRHDSVPEKMLKHSYFQLETEVEWHTIFF